LGQLGLIRVHRWEPAREGCILSVAGLPGPLVRDLDLVMWLAGESPQIVYALDNSANRSTTAAGCHFQIHLGFARGMALIDYSSRLPAGGGYHRVSVIGATGAACADDQQNVQLLFRGGPPQAFQTGEGTRHLAILIQNFVDAIATGQELTTTVNAWTDVFHVVESVRQSLDTHRAIHRKGA
jgi:predicted dehydrogenase